MTESRHHHAALEPLIKSMLDGTLDETGWTQLADLLRHDAEARAAYVHMTTLHAALNWQAGRTQIATPSVDLSPVPVAARLGWDRRWAAAAALVVVAVAAWLALSPELEAPRPAPEPAASPVYAMLSDLSDAAAFAEGSRPASLGGDLPAGPLRLTAGRAQLMLDGGAVVDLVGPCVFETTGPNAGRLTRGRLEAFVRPEARGFIIDTPSGVRVVDLGTRFEMQIDRTGGASVFVHEGRVQVQWDGRSEEFEAGDAVRLAHGEWIIRHAGAGAGVIAENFDDAVSRGLHPALEDRAGVYDFSNRVAENTGRRDYIRTRAADFTATDFVAEITYTLPSDSIGPNIVFFGIGDGVPDRGEWDNPMPSLYLEAPPMRIEIDRGAGSDDVVIHPFKDPGPGTHRLQIRKFGDAVTFAIDEHYEGGPFHADQTRTLSLAATAPFLDTTNSRIFFGAEHTPNPSSFDDLSITILARDPTKSPTHQEN